MINLKTKEEIKVMHSGGKILAKILKELADSVKPGIPTKAIEKLANELVLFYGVGSAFLNYQGYPASICVSINDEVVHGLPSDRIIAEGDLVSLDFGIKYDNFYLDSAVTVLAGKNENPQIKKILEATKKALEKGIEKATLGNYIGDISHAIQSFVEKEGFSVIRDLVGHGIGKDLHEEPQIPNFGKEGQGPELVEGMILAIEPMVSAGDWKIILGDDKFTYKTKDGSLAAHFEHTVAVTKKSPIVLTI